MKQTPNSKRAVAGGALVIIVAFVTWIALGGSDNPKAGQSDQADTTVEVATSTHRTPLGIGEVGRVTEQVFGATSPEAFDLITKAAVAKDEQNMRELVATGQALVVDADTKAKLLESGFLKIKVRLMSGTHEGQAVYLDSKFVSGS